MTDYSYSPLDLVSAINYNGAKQAAFQYNKVGELVRMEDWTGVNTFELDLLGQLKRATDHKGSVTEYTYDEVGNQTSVKYPDGGVVQNTYDEVYNLTKVKDPDQGVYTYIYDAANRAVEQIYPNGWIEENTYDPEGNLLKVMDTDPFPVVKKTVKKFEYKYDAEGNLIWEYKRDSDGIDGLVSCTDYTYDALNQLTGSARATQGYPHSDQKRAYEYDSLGNLVRETRPENGQKTTLTYQYNNLNQMVHKQDCSYISSITRLYDYGYTYDKRGNLVKEEEICAPTTQGPRNITIATYRYDETNKMVSGTNADGEYSNYTYNGLGVRVGTELILNDNTHGYTDFHCRMPSVETSLEGPQGPEVVLSDYVIDYTRLNIDQRVLMEHEVDGYDFRYVYGLDLVNVKVTGEGSDWWGQNIKQCIFSNYVHTDRLGSVVNLSDQYGRVPARIDYDAWGSVTAYDSITVDGGFRILLPEITYAGHQYDDILNQYYAKARMYDADNRRFTAVDPVKGNITDPLSLVQYIYVINRPLVYVDPLGTMHEIGDGVSDNPSISEQPPTTLAPEPGPRPDLITNPDPITQHSAIILFDSGMFTFNTLESNVFQIKEGLIEADDMIDNVQIIDTANWSDKDAEEWWNSLPDEGVEAVVIYSHANDSVIQLSKRNNSGFTVSKLNGTNPSSQITLTQKRIGYFILYSCNNAHQGSPNNIAREFTNYLLPGSRVIGVDGTFYTDSTQANIRSSDSFRDYLHGEDREPYGFWEYKVEENGYISETLLGHYSKGLANVKDITSWIIKEAR